MCASSVKQHHKRLELCTSRSPYRQGRQLKAVKVYTVNQESQYLLIQGVPSLNLEKQFKKLCSSYGEILQHKLLAEYPSDQFTQTNLVQYSKIQSARYAKRKLDDYAFYGGSLHVCYAPEYESLQETRSKLQQRRIDIARRLRQLDAESRNSSNITAAVANQNEDSVSKAQTPVSQTCVSKDIAHDTNNKPSQSSEDILSTKPKDQNDTKLCNSVIYGKKHSLLNEEGPSCSKDFFHPKNAQNPQNYHNSGHARPSLVVRPPWQSTAVSRYPWHAPGNWRHGLRSSSTTQQYQSSLSNYGPTNPLITQDLHTPIYPSMAPDRTGASLSNTCLFNKNKYFSGQSNSTPFEEYEGKDNEKLKETNRRKYEVNGGKTDVKGSLIIKEYSNLKTTKSVFLPRQSNAKKILPSHLLSTVTNTVKEMSSTEKGSLNPQNTVNKAKRKFDPVNDKLRSEACILGDVKGPKLPRIEMERREVFKNSETGDTSIDGSVAHIRKQVMQFSAIAPPPQIKKTNKK